MIVRNEARIIARCLGSALPHVDGSFIGDTGSTEATLAIIEEVASRLGKPGAVQHAEWRNFCHNVV